VGCSILLVDDSKITRQVMRKTPKQLFAQSPPVISEVDGGQSAILACRAAPHDLSFLDLTMPGVNGYDVLAAFKASPIVGKVVVMSADVQPKARERALQLGAIAFLPKPPNPEEIRRVLAELGLLGEPTP
jgi:CheY-like chemotaxis protein